MLSFFSGDYPTSTPTNHSTISSPVGFFPGGPSPDSALPSHNKPIDTRHQAAASAINTETHRHHQGGDEMASQQELAAANGLQPITRELPSDLPPQPYERTETFPKNPFSDERGGVAPVVRVPAPSTEATAEGSPNLGKEARRSTSVTSRRTDRSLPANNVSDRASAAGAATAANESPDMVQDLQVRATSIEEQRQTATIGKEEHGIRVGRRLSKIEKRGAKVERTTLHIALQELTEIQGLQEGSIKEEAIFHSLHARALGEAHKTEMDLLAARTANEQGQASLRAAEEALDTSRKHVRETTKMLRKKMEEVDRLQAHKKVDDKELAAQSPVRRVSLFVVITYSR